MQVLHERLHRSRNQACYNSTLMKNQPPDILMEAPPRPRKAFTRQVWTQVFLPVGLAVLVLVALVVVLWRAQVAEASTWADVALVMLILPAFILGILMLLALGGLVYVLAQVARGVPGPARQALAFLRRAETQVRRGAGAVTRPFVVVPAVWAAIATVFRSLGSIFRKK